MKEKMNKEKIEKEPLKENNMNKILPKLNNPKLFVLYSFLISSLLMILYFVFGGMLGGKYLVMRSDLISGGIGGIKEICRDILSGNNIWFSSTTGLGMGNALTLATSFFSPFNLIYLIFFKADENIITAIVIMLKVGCISASFEYFSKKVLNNDKFSSIIISVFYSLCAFTIAYGTIQIIWLDAMLILPLLITSIIDCIKNDKRILLTILYAYLFVSHFYMGYAVGFFSLLFVLLYTFVIYMNDYNKKLIKTKLFNWALSVVVAILLSAIVWIPTLFFLLANRAEDSSEAFTLEGSLLQIINSLFWGNGYGIEGTYSYIYCGIPILFLVPLFFINKKINAKEKILGGVLLGFFAICTILTPLNMFMHVFDQPDSFWFRYSFIISFCLCAMASRQLTRMEDVRYKLLFIILASACGIYLFAQQTVGLWLVDGSLCPTQNSNVGFLVNLLFMSSWIFVYFLYSNKKLNYISAALSILVAGAEIISCSFAETSIKEESEPYYEWYSNMEYAVNEISKDKDYFRTLCNNNNYINSDTWFGYNGFSDLGSEEKYAVRNALCNLGFSTSTRFIDDGGHTPVSEMLLGVKYIIRLPYTFIDYADNDISDEDRYYENEYYNGIGYLVSGNTILYEWAGRNVFENMNTLVSEMTGNDKKCFFQIPDKNIKMELMNLENSEYSDGGGILKRTDDAGRLYITVYNKNYSKVYVQFQTNDIGNYGYDFFIMGTKNAGNVVLNNAKLSAASEMFYNEESDKYNVFLSSTLEASPDKIEYDAFNIYGLDEAVLKEQHEILDEGRYVVDEWSNGHINGHVYNSGDRNLLFLSIPYDPGWKVKINGTEGEIVRLIDGSFIGVFLPGAGEYNVEFDYECPGLKYGMIVSLCGLLAFLAIVFEKKIKKPKDQSNEKKA
ncbi:MAG: YfhO family protein [Lachnospiraceae bacterium]|nr:YfhO family protein [Lachnospiraceae bacterium]